MNLDSNQPKRLKYLVLILVLLVVAFFVISIESRIIKESPAISQQTFSFERININFDVLKNPLLQELQPFEIISLPEEIEIGRENPFIPY